MLIACIDRLGAFFMKKRILTGLAIVWTVLLIQVGITYFAVREPDAREAFGTLEITGVGSYIDAYGYYGDVYLTEETRRQMLVNLAKELGITEGYEVTASEGDSYSKLSLGKMGKGSTTGIDLVSYEGTNQEGEATHEQYILINLRLEDQGKEIGTYKNRVEQIYRNIGIEPVLGYGIQGTMLRKTDENTREDIAKGLFGEMNAAYVTKVSGDAGQYESIYGYSRDIKRYVYQNGEKINVNVVFTYDEEGDRTNIYLAVPFLNESY